MINTTDATVSTVIDRQFVENLPLNGRSFNTLLQLTPGVVIAQASMVSRADNSAYRGKELMRITFRLMVFRRILAPPQQLWLENRGLEQPKL